jgi:hypothetical protein
MSANAAQVAKISTLPANPGLPLSHSNTVMLGFGPYSLESIRLSATPVAISL